MQLWPQEDTGRYINVKHSVRNPPKSFYKATWETNVKNSWRNLHWTFSEATAICKKKKRGRLWDKCKELFGEHSKEPFGRRKPFAAKNPFTMAEDPKANGVGEKVGGTFHRTLFEEKIGRQIYKELGEPST